MKACVRGIFAYGLETIGTVHELATLTTRTFMCNKKFLLEMARNSSILNFPVTGDQIRKYYTPLDAWTMSHMRMRNKSLKGLNNPTERQEINTEIRKQQ